MPQLDKQTLHEVRRMAAAGASSPMIAARFDIPVEQVEFVCGRVHPGEGETYGRLVPQITEVDERRDDPAIPFAFLPKFLRMPAAEQNRLIDLWLQRRRETHDYDIAEDELDAWIADGMQRG